ncbi:MAG: cell division DNA translocase FtsK [Sodalis sp. Psp]|nr:cell division DNA translocase FtsK [Sodalis sp. Psp]MCR3757361.1 cell division DNA translocase FtsK [Sodalis sp. Ppy]
MENKDITLKKIRRSHRLMVVMSSIFTLYLTAALISFNPSDPSWSQTDWNGPVHNLGGRIGAWLADTLFFIFGVPAYAIPLIMLFFFWNGFVQHVYISFFSLSFRLIGSLALLLASCGLAELNIDDLYYFISGGVIGSLLSTGILLWFNDIGTTIALLCIWTSGFTLFTGWSWLTIAEKIGAVVLDCLTFVSKRIRHNNKHYDYRRFTIEESDNIPLPLR